MKAIFQVVANGKDITSTIEDRVLKIHTTDKPGLEADECEVELDDRDGAIQFPPKGATLRISLGWEGKGLSLIGEYAIDEITVRGPPDTMIIRGKPANMRATSKTHRNGSWENAKLADIMGDVARRNKWVVACSVDAVVPRADQFGESDLHFVTRLARMHGATATVKAGKLIVTPRGAGKSASGMPLPAITLARSDVGHYEVSFPDRASFAAVRTKVHDAKSGKKIDLVIPNPDAPPGASAVHTERHAFGSTEAAKSAASARLQKLNHNTAKSSLTLTGRADVSSEKTLTLTGFKKDVDGDYLVETVEHTYEGRSWETKINLNAGNKGKAKVGHGKKKAKSVNLVVPPPSR
ncbi:phage late control D family protein [Pandoraea sp. ISTKB]|uniref:phage late control D family protein n=1 Tax=Pandoraea sp. ISTKB TaxID=1586708 RepID=UPI0008478799|nr:contractile injection system protein, VgrG/Pvc8 family [Pandoraea sp. ISTKB]ODP33059.1 late control protein [Pandoraea sp. ISTKB]